MTYAEIDGIWHRISGDLTVCGKPYQRTAELDEEPVPMCWRCREG